MNTKTICTICFLLITTVGHSQWEMSIGPGAAIPITGYGEVVKTGWLLEAGGQYRLKKHLALGIKTHFARLQKDKNPNDAFLQARMTVAPLIFTAEYGDFLNGNFQPYLTGGIGISFFNINYDTTSTQGAALNNVSFTMMPQIGFRYTASKSIFPFIESGLILIADGPPIGFPQGEKMTGYAFIAAGILYRFR